MKEVYQPHDKFFKELMSRKKSALDFLRYYLPEEIVNQLDLPTLSISKDSAARKRVDLSIKSWQSTSATFFIKSTCAMDARPRFMCSLTIKVVQMGW